MSWGHGLPARRVVVNVRVTLDDSGRLAALAGQTLVVDLGYNENAVELSVWLTILVHFLTRLLVLLVQGVRPPHRAQKRPSPGHGPVGLPGFGKR